MKKSTAVARYHVVADTIRQQIHAGTYMPGDRLPSESELCRQHGISRGTVVRAIELLVSEGTVNRKQGAGSFVARPSLHRRAGRLLSFSETAASDGHITVQRLVKYQPASEEQAREFGCSSRAMSLVRLRYIDGVACALHTSLIPQHIAQSVPALSNSDPDKKIEQPQFSLYRSLEQAGHTVEDARERVTTRLVSDAEADLLQIQRPAAVMVVFRTSYDAGGDLLEAVEAVYHSGYYTYDIHLLRSVNPSQSKGFKVHSFGGGSSKTQDRR